MSDTRTRHRGVASRTAGIFLVMLLWSCGSEPSAGSGSEASERRPALKRALNKPGKMGQAGPGDFVQAADTTESVSGLGSESAGMFGQRT